MARKVEGMVQTTIWIPQAMHQRLKQIGKAGGASEEIRTRLELSFEAEKVPAKTRELLDAIAHVAGETAVIYGNWFEDAFAFEVVKESVESLLAAARPKGDVVINPDRVDFVELTMGADLLPKDVSRIFVSDVMRAKAKRADEGKRR